MVLKYPLASVIVVFLVVPCFSQTWTDLTSFQTAENGINRIRFNAAAGTFYCAGFTCDSLLLSDSIFARSNGGSDCFIMAVDTSFTSTVVNSFGGPGIDAIYDMVVRPNGNIVVTGCFQDSMTIGTVTLTAPVPTSFFIAELSGERTPKWSFVNSALAGYSVASVGDGANVYVSGLQKDTAIFIPGDTLFGHGSEDIFLACYDTGGIAQWAVNIGSTWGELQPKVSVFGDSAIYLTGVFYDTLFFNGTEDTLAFLSDNEQSFIAKFGAGGSLLWKKHLSGRTGVTIYSQALDSLGNSYITGKFYDTLQIDTVKVIGGFSASMFLIKIAPDGTLLWIRTADNANGYDITPGNNGDMIITGTFTQNTSFGEFSFVAVDNENAFLAGYSLEGECTWALSAFYCTGSKAKTVAVNADVVVTSGSISTSFVERPCTITFGTLTAPFNNESIGRTFLAMADPDGTGVIRKNSQPTRARIVPENVKPRYFDLSGRDITRTITLRNNSSFTLRRAVSGIIIREAGDTRSRVIYLK